MSGSATDVRVGVDLCSAGDVAESIAEFGERYLRRIYTDAELADCATAPSQRAERLAARFAAKEAAVKVLRPVDTRPEWRDIEVVRAPEGWCELRLAGGAAELARAAKIETMAVSLTHEHDLACAVVVAGIAQGGRRGGRQSSVESGRTP